MTDLRVRCLRGDVEETTHTVSAVLVDRRGVVVASVGDPEQQTPLRSAAKPFQAAPLVEDGVVERFDFSSRELALTCASHNSERQQVDIVAGLLERLGFRETDLACGPHRPLFKDLGFHFSDAEPGHVELAAPSPLASNCSGKHAGMLAQAKANGWTAAGYHRAGHPVQNRCRTAVAQWCGLDERAIGEVVDGCGVVCWVLPLRSLATGYAALAGRGAGAGAGARGAGDTIAEAMTAHPELIAGARRACTALMCAFPGRVIAKVGAGGVYGTALLEAGLGLALKVADGDHRAAVVALLAVLDQLELLPGVRDALPAYAEPVILNTRREHVGKYEAVGVISHR